MCLGLSFSFLLAGIRGFQQHREETCLYSGPSLSRVHSEEGSEMPSAPIPLSLPLPRGPCQETAPPCPPPCPPSCPAQPSPAAAPAGWSLRPPRRFEPAARLVPGPCPVRTRLGVLHAGRVPASCGEVTPGSHGADGESQPAGEAWACQLLTRMTVKGPATPPRHLPFRSCPDIGEPAWLTATTSGDRASKRQQRRARLCLWGTTMGGLVLEAWPSGSG